MIRLFACLAVFLFAAHAHALDYPTKPVRLIMPFPPGGSVDGLARLIATRLTERWGQTIVVEARPAADGNIAYGAAATSAPDGYTWVIAANSIAANPSLYKNVPFDTLRDFTPITLIATHPSFLVTHPSVPAGSVQELVAYAKSRPGQITFGSAGTGTIPHLAGGPFKVRTGVDIVHAPFKGPRAALHALPGGHFVIVF